MVRPWGSNTEGFRVTNTRAFIVSCSQGPAPAWSYRCRDRREDAIEDGVDVAEMLAEIERLLELSGAEHAHHVAVFKQERLEILLLVERPHGVALHPLVGLFARDSAAGELEEHRPREHDAARALQIFQHALRIYDHAADDAR